MRSLIDALANPAWLFAADGTPLGASDSARRIASPEALQAAMAAQLGQPVGGAPAGVPFPPKPAPDRVFCSAIPGAVAALLRGAQQAPLHGPCRDLDGNLLHLEGAARWIDPRDRAAGILVQAREIASSANGEPNAAAARIARLEAEAAEARAQVQRFRHMADSAPGAVYERVDTVDGRWVYTYHSAGLPDLFGVTAEDVAEHGRSVFRHVDPAEVREIAAEVARVRVRGDKYERVMTVHHPKLGPRAINLSTRPYPQPDGSIIWFGNMADITPQLNAERRASEAAEALRESHARLNRLTENAPGALCEYRQGVEGEVGLTYFNARLPAMVGVTAEALRADPRVVMTHLAPAEIEPLLARIRAAMADPAPFSCELHLLHPEDGERRLLLSVQPDALPDGGVAWYASLLDITRQVETERRAADALAELRVLHDRLNSLAENAPAALYEYVLDSEGKPSLPFFTARLPELFGLDAALIEDDGAATLLAIHPDDRDRVGEATERSRRDLSPFSETFRTQPDATGRTRWVTANAQPMDLGRGRTRWQGFMFDSTAQVEAERRAAEAADKLRGAHERFLKMAAAAPGAIFEYRRTPDHRMKFLFASPRLPELLGLSGDHALRDGAELYRNVPEADRAALRATVEAAMATRTPIEFRHRVDHPTRGERWLKVSLSPEGEDAEGVIWYGNAMDVTTDVQRENELRRAHETAERMREENERQALHDGLTGLPNRRAYDRETEARRRAGHAAGAIVRVDLDHFKSVNDTLGHEAGDAVLQRVAGALRAALGPGDVAARIGGDEFSILPAPSRSLEEICAMIETVRADLAAPFFFEGRLCRFGASFGVARTEAMAEEATDLPVFADAALYRAKELGRNRVELFTPELHRDILADRRLAIELHEALERSAFTPHFQPQFSAKTGRLTGCETLLRWPQPDGRMRTPESFMHVAEHLRIVPEIDRMMMLKAGGALARWREAGVCVPKISFNVSSGRMQDPDVVSLAAEIAGGPTKVTFELLESILVEEESDVFRYHLDKIREAGIEIEIDDFGSGHASIIGLMEIAPSALKIDRRIVAPVARDARSASLVRAIVEIAETLGIGTVAEGVETAEQAAILREMGCDVLQGYHFARPLSEADFAAAAKRWRIAAA